jgi:hypothetical protein
MMRFLAIIFIAHGYFFAKKFLVFAPSRSQGAIKIIAKNRIIFIKMGEKKEKEIDLGGCRVIYCLKTSARAKNLRIAVKPGGVVAVTRPLYIPEKFVEDFLVKKSFWVLEKIGQMKNRQSFLSAGSRAEFLRVMPSARKLVLEKIKRLNQIYCVEFNRVAIRDQHTRWGSCSARGNLNFNYRVALLPERLSDYVVAHELCHLREMNHSRRFWALVAIAIPDYAARRKELRADYC